MGAKAATTAVRDASSARFAAVLSTDQPPQLKPMIMVATAPTAAPWARCLTESLCNIEGSGMICPSVKWSKSSGHPDGCRLNEFFLKDRRLALACRVNHHAHQLDECR